MHPFWRSLWRSAAVGVLMALAAVFLNWADPGHSYDATAQGWFGFWGALIVLPWTRHQAYEHSRAYYE